MKINDFQESDKFNPSTSCEWRNHHGINDCNAFEAEHKILFCLRTVRLCASTAGEEKFNLHKVNLNLISKRNDSDMNHLLHGGNFSDHMPIFREIFSHRQRSRLYFVAIFSCVDHHRRREFIIAIQPHARPHA